MDIIVREYDDGDLNEVNIILKEAFDVTKDNFNIENIKELVSVCDGEVSGYLILTRVVNPVRKFNYYLIDYVCVLSKYRKTGVSDKLINYAVDLAKNEGAKYLQLTCAPFRVGGHKLYERCGFKMIDTDLFRKELV